MDVIFYAVGIIIAVILAGVAVGAVLASSSDRKRKDELRTRYLTNQPWDAHSADGRGNR